MNHILEKLQQLALNRLNMRLKHLRGRHNQLDHAWNRGMGQGGGGVALAPNQQGPVVSQDFYRKRKVELMDQKRQGLINNTEMRRQLDEMQGKIPENNIVQPTTASASQSMQNVNTSPVTQQPTAPLEMLNQRLNNLQNRNLVNTPQIVSASTQPSSTEYNGYTLNSSDNPVDDSRYSPEARAAAKQLRDRMATVEPEITRNLIDTGNSHGMELVGLDYRLKSEKSIARKIDSDRAQTGLDVDSTAASMSDVIRYTMVAPTTSYVDSVKKTVQDLIDRGYQLRIKNYWGEGDPYQGINVACTAPDGTKFELQFHTPESHDAKEPIHKYYEVYRESTDNAERWNAYNIMRQMALLIPLPLGEILSIGDLKYQPFTDTMGKVIDFVSSINPY